MFIKKSRLILLSLILIFALACGAVFVYLRARQASVLPPLGAIHTIAGADTGAAPMRLINPFGIAVGADASVYLTDGETGKLWRIARDGSAQVITENLDTPSAIALAPDGSLVIAETGAHVIRRINKETGQAFVVAGHAGRAGYADGAGSVALFNAPVGVAVGSDGQIFVADTYNDRIRKIDTSGNVSTLAGTGEVGFADAEVGADARFDTPCGIAVAPDGSLVIADTGNQRLRRVWQTGRVRTIAGTGERSSKDGLLFTASFNKPMGIAVDADGTIYVADAGGAALRICGWGVLPQVMTVAGGNGTGFQDGPLEGARLNRPAGIATAPDGTIVFTDTGNKLVRAVVGEKRERGSQLSTEAFASLSLTATQMRAAAPPRWPYEPPDRSREIAATFGEVRGELSADDKDAWFHNGLDIPGAYGERVRAVRAERVLDPFSVEDVGTTRERIRFPTLGYIHLRIGRDVSDAVLDEQKFLPQRDAAGRLTGMRVRRGTRFAVGETIGTLNNQNHVHLIAGYVGAEFNALAALELPGVRDTVAPVLEKDGVRFYDAAWDEIRADASPGRNSRETARLNLEGDVRIVVRAYDQMDGNAARRRLGLYRLGYQVLTPDGAPVQGFNEPLVTISFESLPHDEMAAQLAYAAGSRSGATGQTIFAYIVTNIVRDRAAREGFWEASKLPAGDYLLRVFAEDFFGNRTTHDTPVHVMAQSR